MEKQARFEIIKRFIENKNEEAILACLERLEKDAETIGYGENAEILALTNNEYLSGVCVKKLKKFPKIKDNRPETEFEYQQEINNKHGVRTPLSICHIRDTVTGQEYLIMERIKGVSLGDIGKGLARFPEKYNHEKFFEKLKADLKKMHDGGIYHRDLHWGNVMVDEETGDPVIIDFGTASRVFRGDDEKYWQGQVLLYNPETGRYTLADGLLRNDEEAYDNLKDTMKTHWFNQESHKGAAA